MHSEKPGFEDGAGLDPVPLEALSPGGDAASVHPEGGGCGGGWPAGEGAGWASAPGDSLRGLKVHLTTFGCQMNKYDSGMVAGLLSGAGARFVEDEGLQFCPGSILRSRQPRRTSADNEHVIDIVRICHRTPHMIK